MDKLKDFVRWVIRAGWDGDVDGAEIQEEAEKFGLLKIDTVTKEDVANLIYYSKDDIGNTTIYRFTDILKEEEK